MAPTIAAVGTFVPGNANSGTTQSFGAPSGIVVDSLLVAMYTVEHNASGTQLSAPSGWLDAPDRAGAFQAIANGTALYIFYRIATAADVGASAYDMPVQSGRYRRGAILRISGHDPSNPWDGGDGAIAASSTDAPSVAVTTTGVDRLLLWIASSYNLSAWSTLPTSFTEITEFASTSEVNTAAQRTLASAGTVTTGAIATGATAGKAAWIGAIRPASTADTGALAATAPKPTAAIAGTVTGTGALAGTSPKPTASLAGVETQTGLIAASSPRPTSAISGTVTATAAVAGTSPRPVAAVTGSVGYSGPLSATAPKPTASIAAVVRGTGALAGTSPKPTAALTGTAEVPPLPSAVLDLSYWHLTTPADGGSGTAEQINQPELDTYESEFFFVETFLSRQVVTCRAPVDGFTTSGASGATRAELRQRRKGTYALAAIDPNAAGRWQLETTFYVDPTSITGGSNPRQEVICAQIHGAGDSPIPLILSAEWTSGGSAVTPRIRIFKNGPGVGNLVSGISTTTPISIRIRLDAGRLKVWGVIGERADLPPITTATTWDWPVSDFTDDVDWYYKHGAYNKTTIASGSSGEAVVRIVDAEILEPSDPDPTLASGPLAAVTPKPGAALAGGVLDSGAVSAVVPPATAALTGDVVAAGGISTTSPVATGSFTTTLTDPAQLSGGTPRTSAALTGTVRADGTLVTTTPAARGAIDATGQAAGPLAGIAPAPSATLTADIRAGGALSGGLPRPSAALAGDVALSGVVGATTPRPNASFEMSEVVSGELIAAAPLPRAALRGEGEPEEGVEAGEPKRVSVVQAGSLTRERGLQAGTPRKVVTIGAGQPAEVDAL